VIWTNGASADEEGVRFVVAGEVISVPERVGYAGGIIRRHAEDTVMESRCRPFVEPGCILVMEPERKSVHNDEFIRDDLAVRIPTSPVEMHLISGCRSFDGAARKPYLGRLVLRRQADECLLATEYEGQDGNHDEHGMHEKRSLH
jgi:hypothetical protein